LTGRECLHPTRRWKGIFAAFFSAEFAGNPVRAESSIVTRPFLRRSQSNCGLEVPIYPTVEEAQLDLSFPDDPLDLTMMGYRPPELPVFSDSKTWSSLAAVLFLHAALTCVLWLSPKQHPGARDWIDVKLVSLQGCPGAAVSDVQGGAGAGSEEQPAAVAPANQEPPHPLSPAENVQKPPAPVSNARPAPHPKKTQRVVARPMDRHEITCEQQSPPAQTETGADHAESTGQTAGSGAGSSNQVSAGGGNGPGGPGLAERPFGSPDGPNFLHKVLPAYPALARKLEKEGTVLLRLTIDDRGRPVEIEVLRKAGFGFDEEAVRAVQSSTFVPAKKEGKPLACKALLPIRFVLKNS
jgi:protein TonB